MADKHLVRKTYKRDRTGQQDRIVPTRLQVYIRPDQEAWMARECAKRSDAARGRNAPMSELVREALDLLIEYTAHQEFMKSKVGRARSAKTATKSAGSAESTESAATPAVPAGGPAARSPESAVPDPRSSDNSEPA